MYNDPDIYDWADGKYHKTQDITGRGDADGLKANMIRISATDSDGDKVYLCLGGGYENIPFGDGWELPDFEGQWKAGPMFADLSTLGPLNSETEMTFAIELGYGLYDNDFNVITWKVLAAGTESYQNLVAGGHIIDSELSYQQDWAWSPGMSVPEPNSAILIFIGACMLLLIRPKFNKGRCIS